jgi:hypothetical protein
MKEATKGMSPREKLSAVIEIVRGSDDGHSMARLAENDLRSANSQNQSIRHGQWRLYKSTHGAKYYTNTSADNTLAVVVVPMHVSRASGRLANEWMDRIESPSHKTTLLTETNQTRNRELRTNCL